MNHIFTNSDAAGTTTMLVLIAIFLAICMIAAIVCIRENAQENFMRRFNERYPAAFILKKKQCEVVIFRVGEYFSVTWKEGKFHETPYPVNQILAPSA